MKTIPDGFTVRPSTVTLTFVVPRQCTLVTFIVTAVNAAFEAWDTIQDDN